ncbi:hypothetical protein Y032_0083g1615 [Ancylostoma ceylanicum]|uniref:Uncharacterized protein n=1 Tax=Ancylostoma ceylanicum TaxID=53326 RepID=A0A016TR88_9BILA|nr:hypothetical protein Y032_0083g1615 [Ancylostoma ceylanicum]
MQGRDAKENRAAVPTLVYGHLDLTICLVSKSQLKFVHFPCKNTRLLAHLFNKTVLPALTYASETWALRRQDENAISVVERSIKRVMLE